MAANIHVSPTTDEHLTDGLDCWCSPRYGRPCDECEVEVAPDEAAAERIFERGAGCWKCEAGLIYITRAEAESCDEPLVIVHNR